MAATRTSGSESLMTVFRLIARVCATLVLLAYLLAVTSPAVAQEREATQRSADSDLSDILERASSKGTSLDDLRIITIPLTADEFATLADVWQNHLRVSLAEAVRIRFALETSKETDQAALRSQLDEQAVRQVEVENRYEFLLELWRDKGGDEAEIKRHRDYLEGLFVESFRATDARTLLKIAMAWLTSSDGGLGILITLVKIGLAIWGTFLVALSVRRLVSHGLRNIANLTSVLRAFLLTAAYWATLIVGSILILGYFGMNVTAIFALFGGLSLIVGLALQTTLSNFANGLLIILQKPFDVGDYVWIAGKEGTIEHISITSTSIRTPDNKMVVIPNTSVWRDAITNADHFEKRRIDLVFSVGHSNEIPRVIEALEKMVADNDLCLKEPAPRVFVGQVSEKAVMIYCRPWTHSKYYWELYWVLIEGAQALFKREGIEMPRSYQDITVYNPEKTTS